MCYYVDIQSRYLVFQGVLQLQPNKYAPTQNKAVEQAGNNNIAMPRPLESKAAGMDPADSKQQKSYLAHISKVINTAKFQQKRTPKPTKISTSRF